MSCTPTSRISRCPMASLRYSPIILFKIIRRRLVGPVTSYQVGTGCCVTEKTPFYGPGLDLSGSLVRLGSTNNHRLCRICQLETVGPALVDQQECQSRQLMQVISSRVLVSHSSHPVITRRYLPPCATLDLVGFHRPAWSSVPDSESVRDPGDAQNQRASTSWRAWVPSHQLSLARQILGAQSATVTHAQFLFADIKC